MRDEQRDEEERDQPDHVELLLDRASVHMCRRGLSSPVAWK